MSLRPVSLRLNSPPPERPQPEQPEQQLEPKQPDEEDKPWVRKNPFDPMIKSYKVVKSQYNSMERFMDAISSYLDSEPADVLDRIKALPKP